MSKLYPSCFALGFRVGIALRVSFILPSVVTYPLRTTAFVETIRSLICSHSYLRAADLANLLAFRHFTNTTISCSITYQWINTEDFERIADRLRTYMGTEIWGSMRSMTKKQ